MPRLQGAKENPQEFSMDAVQAARERYALMLREKVQLKSDALVQAFAHVPRERFLGPGPWRVISEQMVSELTQDDNPIHLYHNVLVSIDEARQLNNGLPSGLAKWFDALELRQGEKLVHIGCGTGYYSAILAHLVGTAGRVIAIELDADLARRARRNLDDLPQVAVVCANGSDYDPGPADAIFVNAGATHPCPIWISSLKLGGRAMFPLIQPGNATLGGGLMMSVIRERSGYLSNFVSMVGIYRCEGAVDPEAERLLTQALNGGGHERVRSFRSEFHQPDESCWLHGSGYCFSTLATNETP
jgi:protein-L-isoaspartate(D-aspartate) O-methyltransferase